MAHGQGDAARGAATLALDDIDTIRIVLLMRDDRSEVAGADAPRRGPGRPRCEKACEAVRTAALELLDEGGFDGLTIEGVAERAGVGKATIYRWWSNKAALIVDAFFTRVSPALEFEDTGSLRGDLVGQLRLVVREMLGPHGRLLTAIVSALPADPALGEAFRTRWVGRRRAEGMKVFDRAAARGELAAHADRELLFDLLYGPLYFRLIVQYCPLREPRLAEKLVDAVLGGVKPARRRTTRRGS